MLSHIWGKLNLPTLLFKVGLLTLINMDSLIYLDKLKLIINKLLTLFNINNILPIQYYYNNILVLLVL